MKSNFQSFSLLLITLTALSIVTTVQAQGFGPFLCALTGEKLPPPPYCTLVQACESSPNNTAMVTQYQNGAVNAWADGACMPYTVNGSIAQVAVFCQTVFCTGYVNVECGDTVADLALVGDLPLYNVLNFTKLIGKAARCWQLL